MARQMRSKDFPLPRPGRAPSTQSESSILPTLFLPMVTMRPEESSAMGLSPLPGLASVTTANACTLVVSVAVELMLSVVQSFWFESLKAREKKKKKKNESEKTERERRQNTKCIDLYVKSIDYQNRRRSITVKSAFYLIRGVPVNRLTREARKRARKLMPLSASLREPK